MSLAETLLDSAVAGIVALPIRQFVEDVSTEVDYQFIDEVFHFPQFETINSGDFTTWDPKITTPPGLYYLSALYSKIFNVEPTLGNMRFFNFVGSIFLIAVLILIRFKSREPGFSTAAIYLNPLLSIFYSLYYTDVWATAIVVAAYGVIVWKPFNCYLATSILSAALGLLSLAFRQTNIAWCLFLLAVLIDSKAKDDNLYKYEEGFGDVITFVKVGVKNLAITVPYAVVGLLFLGFTYFNGGVALGDKENHVLVPHLAQLCYCVTFITVFTLPIWVSFDFLLGYVKANLLTVSGLVFNAAWIPLLTVVVQGFTIIHPFVLADNRHYTFYIVKNFIISSDTARFRLIPLYHFSFYVVFKLFQQNSNICRDKDNSFRRTAASPNTYYAFLLCTALSVCLSPLFEPRYYILPYIFFRLFVRPVASPVLNLSLLQHYNLQIRYAGEVLWLWFWSQAIYIVFLQFTFEWDDLTHLQRIIW